MAKYRRGMRSIISTMTPSTITRIILRPYLSLNTEAVINRSHVTLALAASAARTLAATRSSVPDAAPSANEPIMRVSNGSVEPAYNITVDVDECYFVRGNDGLAYLVSNSSHGADAFGLMCVAYEPPQEKRKVKAVHHAGSGAWMG